MTLTPSGFHCCTLLAIHSTACAAATRVSQFCMIDINNLFNNYNSFRHRIYINIHTSHPHIDLTGSKGVGGKMSEIAILSHEAITGH